MRQVWREVASVGLGDHRVFKDRAVPGARVGMVYTVHLARESDGASLVVRGPNAPSFKERWANRDDVVEWECAEAADEARQRSAKLASDAAKVDEIAACLR